MIRAHHTGDRTWLRLAVSLAAPFILAAVIRGLQLILPELAPRTLLQLGVTISLLGALVMSAGICTGPPSSAAQDWLVYGGVALVVLAAALMGMGKIKK